MRRLGSCAEVKTASVTAAMKGMPAATVVGMANLMARGLLMAQLRMTVAMLSIVLLTAGFGLALALAVREPPALQPRPRQDPASAPIATASSRSTPNDRHGDSLPKYAKARMGTIRLHSGSLVNQVVYTPDGKSLVTVDRVPIVRIWDAATGQIVREIGDPQAAFPDVSPSRSIALSPDGKTLATVDYPSWFRLWDVATGRERRQWHAAKTESYDAVSFAPDGRTVAVSVRWFDEATQKSESFINLWDTAAPTERRRRIAGEWVRLWDLKFSADGKTLAAASTDIPKRLGNKLIGPATGSVRLWNTATGREWRRFSFEHLDTGSLAVSPDGKLLAAAVSDGTVRFYDLTTGQECRPRVAPERMRPPEGDVKATPGRPEAGQGLAFSPAETVIAFQQQGAIHLWDIARGQERRRFAVDRDGAASLSFSPDAKTLASCGTGPAVRLWDLSTGREVFAQSGHGLAIRTLIVSPADGTVFTGGDDGTIRHWDPSSGQELELVGRLEGPVEALAIAHDGKTLFVRGTRTTHPGQAGQMSLWSVAERREIRRLLPFGDRDVHYIAYSPDDKTVASQGRIWDTGSGKLLVTLRHQDPHNGDFLGCSPIFYTPDGKQIITAEPDGVWVWEIGTGQELRQAARWSNFHDRATLSPDGRFLATHGPGGHSRGESADPPIILWELASGQEIARLEANGEALLLRPFSPDGRFLASACRHRGAIPNSTVRVLDLATGREVRRFEGHRGSVTAVAFTPDGRSLVSGSEDATALVWDLSDMRDERTLGAPLTSEMLRARWDELASDDASAAYRAARALSIPSAVAFVREHLRPATLSDPKGVPAAIGPIAPPEVLRTLRAIAVLERLGTPEARAVLEQMARGNPDAIETYDAKLALDCLNRRWPATAEAGNSVK
jgi:WD40 repeat protein